MKPYRITIVVIIISFGGYNLIPKEGNKIDRYKLVNRHNPVNKTVDAWSPFTVGNGGFAFTADVTGLQTFPEYYYKNGIPLQIISDWGWHNFPNPKGYTLKDAYSPAKLNKKIIEFEEIKSASLKHWKHFWNTGGVIDFTGSTDPRAEELERRVILSQYLTATQFAGNFPPQESGLTLSTWFGKHNTEMIWWHAAQFALWNRVPLLEKNLNWYLKTLPYAEETAELQGFKGARWSKMVGPEGRESPGNNPFIIWNEPHPIYLAELCYRVKHDKETLEKYKRMVFETAEYLVSYAYFDKEKRHYVLGTASLACPGNL